MSAAATHRHAGEREELGTGQGVGAQCGLPFFAIEVDPGCRQEFRGGSFRGGQVRWPFRLGAVG